MEYIILIDHTRCFFFNYTSPPDIYTYLHTLSLHDALPIYHRRNRVEQMSNRERVLLKSVGESLVSDVDKRQKLTCRDDTCDFPPVIRAQVHACRVVTAAVQQHDVALRHTLQRVQHFGKTNRQIGRASCRERECQYV